MKTLIILIILGIAVLALFFVFRPGPAKLSLPGESQTQEIEIMDKKIFLTNGLKHSIALDELLAGGPPKDGIPAIDNPKFTTAGEANAWLNDEETGQGFCVGSDCRFYPYQILVWHEIANDVVGGKPVLITYCPLCLTGIVFDRNVNGQIMEFGTSGMLWRSNLVMYNRTQPSPDEVSDLEKSLRLESKKESLWSQVLGEAVVGELTGTKLAVLNSDIIKYSDWEKLHPDTKVLSRDTGFSRSYGFDPYGDYYTSNQVSFGASFNDDRLHPKEFVLGIEIDGKFKAYHSSALKAGETQDTFNGQKIFIQKSAEGIVRMFKGNAKEPLPYIGGFWFSWLAVHPDTELYK